jgi:Protein of unknown function (DUF1573)/Abnormal spindle-like microcephaly-assoc'd, ASPM-SPD-2-Hydin
MKPIVRPIILALCLVSVAVLSKCGGSHEAVRPLTITPASLPNGTLGALYSQAIQAGGGVAPFNWSATGALPHNLQLVPGAGNTATISGTPDTAAQAIAFSIKVTDAANQAAIQSYMVSIVAEQDTLSFSPAAGLTFSPQLVGTASATHTATLTNTGMSPVVINSVAASGDFNQSDTCGSSLAAGANCTITITFSPRQPGPNAATITVVDDTVGSPHLLSLSGIGLTSGPNASLSATSLDFGSWGIGTMSFPVSLTLNNYGTTTLNIGSITTSAHFGESDTCASLASAASCTINVTFTPSTTGTLTGTLSITDNAPGSPQTVSLSGSGFAGSCIPQGGECYGPSHPNCCAAPRGHHSYCSNPTGWGTCTEN